MKVWAPRAVTVLLKLDGGPAAGVEAPHGGKWGEARSFNFATIRTGSYTDITLIVDLGMVGDA